MVYDLDESYRMQSAMAVISRGHCVMCNMILTTAQTPFLEGSSLGPVSLGIMMILFNMGCTDEDIAIFFYDIFGFEMSPNTIWNARKAVATYLEQAMICLIKRMIQLQPWIQMDETMFKRGDGHWGIRLGGKHPCCSVCFVCTH